MIKVIAEDFIKPEFLDVVRPLYEELVAKTKQEKDCIEYNLYVDQDDKGHFIFIEEWPDHEALEAHCQTEHFRRLVPMIDKHQSREGTVLIMDSFM
ncbi:MULTISPECIES: putative quinol monooxygenase [unclassified Dysgonomonas]|uniref:putative quinol monooxygenase n=1 Tax=unclassified Dysgonomonas TaxID=2630389 RepID=UPI0013EA858B|nr:MULTISPECIES: putative quinol monooxygenase [unclassified Dysgonomonas]